MIATTKVFLELNEYLLAFLRVMCLGSLALRALDLRVSGDRAGSIPGSALPVNRAALISKALISWTGGHCVVRCVCLLPSWRRY